MAVYSPHLILMIVAAVFVVGLICVGLFTSFSKSHGLRVAVTGLLVSLALLFIPISQLKFAGLRGYQVAAFAVFLLALTCIWRNRTRPFLLALPFATLLAMAYVRLNWPTGSPSPFQSAGPDGIPGTMLLIFNLGGAAILAFVLLVQCHTPLHEQTEK